MKNKIMLALLIASLLTAFISCTTSVEEGENKTGETQTEGEKDSSGTQDENGSQQPQLTSDDKKSDTTIKAAQYFWGTWSRMDNGQTYRIDESSVYVGSTKHALTSASENSLTTGSLGTFEKQTESVMVNKSIPYFRKGGTNLEYKIRLVGFDETEARLASATSLAGYTLTGSSQGYKGYSSVSKAADDGSATLRSPISGDTQTITVTNADKTVAVIPGIVVETNGSNMGTIPISQDGQYSLKVTGTIADEEKDDGYMYGNNYKSYPMTLTITNVSDVTSATSACEISSADSSLEVSSTDGSDLNLITISTLKAGVTKTVNLTVKYGNLNEAFIDTGINIAITNLKTGKTWVDFVPIRFHRGLVPITVATKSTEGNTEAALNGFVIYPDGNSQFFSVQDGEDKTLYVPSFGNKKPYTLSFSGATVEGELSASTEMFYTVAPGANEKEEVLIPSTLTEARTYYNYGEPNDLETNLFTVAESFEAYLGDGDIDFFSVPANYDEVLFPTGESLYAVKFRNSNGTIIRSIHVQNETLLSDSDLEAPENIPTGYKFDGWYIGNFKATTDYEIKGNTTFTAKWTPIEYTITYNLNGGTNAEENPAAYTIESETITLAEPTRAGYVFNGWYTREEENAPKTEQIPLGSFGNITLFARWSAIEYKISYVLNGGENSEENQSSYTIESASFNLMPPVKSGYTFAGWYTEEDFTGAAITQITKGSTGNKTLYAKWTAITYAISYELNGGINNSENPTSYNIQSGAITLYSPSRTGYTFSGWFTTPDFTGNMVTQISRESVENITLYARWSTTTYNIIYNLNGGTVGTENPTTYTVETPTFTLNSPTKTGYTFDGWYTKASFTGTVLTQIENGSTGNKTLYAKWTARSFAITYELNGGINNGTNPTDYTIESEAIELKNPVRTGYTFQGWYLSSDFLGSPITHIENGTIGDKKLYAKWEVTQYAITYISEGSEVILSPATYTITSDTVTLPIPTRDGYTFQGWYTDPTHTGNVITKIENASTGNKTLYAKWIYGVVVTAANVETIDLSSTDYVNVFGTITMDTIEILCEKLAENEKIFTLDFSKANGIKNITYYQSSYSEEMGSYYISYFENTKVQSIILPSGFTTIGKAAFCNCEYLSKIQIPSSVTSIGDYAFSHCANLTGIDIPDSVTDIGQFAFGHCSSLTKINIPSSVKKLKQGVFYGCTSLEEISIPTSIEYIGINAFRNCASLSKIVIPSSVTTIEAGAFNGCTSLTTVSLPSSITSINGSLFASCTSLTTVFIPTSVISIEYYVFRDCQKLKYIVFEGTKNQWNAIEKNKNWNTHSTITYVLCGYEGRIDL